MHMDAASVGDPVDMIEAIRIDDEEDLDEDDDFNDNSDNDEEPEIGYLSKPKAEHQWSLYRQYFPSKAGGVPAWLDPLNIPSGRSSLCDICGNPLRFLLQVYASITEEESTFHRTLFVFMCPSMTCLLRDQHEQRIHHPERPSRSVKVFRCQLPRYNPFYSSEVPRDDGSQSPVGSGAALCDWCGTWKGDKLCSGCRLVRYCSEKHQVMSWSSGHKFACQQINTTSLESLQVGSNDMWPEFQIIGEGESEDDSNISNESEHRGHISDESEFNSDISNSNTLPDSLILRNEIDDAMDSHLDSFQGDDDKRSLVRFQERIDSAPKQVLRYYRYTNAEPIWPVSSGRPSNSDIPNCSYCGGRMCCEFQILPQLLYHIKVDKKADSVDWASIVVYACEASCEARLPYKHEYAWVQLF